jgi:hypothetical protein
MDEAGILLRVYYELLYEKLENCRDILIEKVNKILTDEIKKQGFKNLNGDKYVAYNEACIAFIDERIEAYNPTGIQYTFDNVRSKEARELELQLDWYDSSREFELLLDAVREKAEPEMSDWRIRELAEELIKNYGAFPDASIIEAYEKAPTLNKLPDYATAKTIEEVVGAKK